MMNGKRMVVKVGTSTLTHSSGSLDLRSMERLVRVLSDLCGAGHEVIPSDEAGRRGSGPVPDDAHLR